MRCQPILINVISGFKTCRTPGWTCNGSKIG